MLLIDGITAKRKCMQKILLPTLIFLMLNTCNKPVLKGPAQGKWHGNLKVMDERELPFDFSLYKRDGSYMIEVYNAGEVLQIDEIRIHQDSIYIYMPVFEEYIAATFDEKGMLGNLINESRNRRVPFEATYGDHPRFPILKGASVDVSGEWEVVFSPDSKDSYPAKGIFYQQDGQVKGTFRTTTGDRRYLQGVVSGDSLKLSTFDGAHAYLFVAGVTDSLMHGTYYSGNHFKEPFIARRNADFELPDGDSLTYLNDGYTRLKFAFPDNYGNMVTLEDERFTDKVVVVQIMGTWCPNCLDETKFLSAYHKEHRGEGLEVVALAFEYYKTPEKAFDAIGRLQERAGLQYPVLLAQYGGANKLEANRKLPMLNRVLSYPTTILLDREGKVRRIHTGFNGPATGQKYEEFKEEFDRLVKQLLSE